METLLNTDACTMPTTERPLRVAEFESLFAEAVTHVERRGSVVRLHMSGDHGLRERVRDLADRETACCSFFVFEIDGVGAHLTLDISVPPARQEILDSLAELAQTLSG